MDELLVAWSAGIIEGEGCLQLKEGKYPAVAVSMTDLDVLEKLRDFYKGNIYKITSRRSYYKQAWVWRVNTIDAVNCIRLILPFLCKRRREKALQVLDGAKRLEQQQQIHKIKVKETRIEIIKLLALGSKQIDIANQLNVSYDNVRSIVSKFRRGKIVI